MNSGLAKVDSKMRKYIVQSYNEISSVSPVEGSTVGGTKVTITSDHVAGPVDNIQAQVGGFTFFNHYKKSRLVSYERITKRATQNKQYLILLLLVANIKTIMIL